ncbi:sodium- and chloride-dependent glycine transporter 1-like [Ylistrum balloti]|uniref:sodium- and chloride-dependent glycine transporter 1-like n=1 Tax=Ylistrum balloti TaxID=509963 RepID=UPI002905F0BF|nr:sodium- and chloride-dependent glycine transporter 1-like [Ylistrum balloti]
MSEPRSAEEGVRLELLDDRNNVVNDLPKREVWSNKVEYSLGLIGYTVGLGSVWRFPYVCMKNGGGAFLIPFFIFTLLCGFPMYYMELCLGQFSGKSALVSWSLCPLLEGIGYSMVLMTMICTWYYGLIVAWVLMYLGYSFFPTQPWSTCNNEWNTDECVVLRSGLEASNTTLWNVSYLLNGSSAEESKGFYPTAATEFWRYKLLNASRGIDDWGIPQWHIILALFFSFASIFLSIIKGVHSAGKVIYVTATAPFVLLLVILVRSLCLAGSLDGVLLYLTPDFSRLLHFQVWLEAALQVFYSLGPTWGGIITLASFHKFHGNCLRDAVITVSVDAFSNFLCGLVVFSILGFLAREANITIEELAESGPGLVFLVYPEALTRLPVPQLWAVLFFAMLFTVGLDSQFGMLEAVISGLTDRFPKTLRKHKTYVLFTVFVLFFLTSIIFSTRAGIYIFQLVDWYESTFCIFMVACLECIIIGWLYGAERFSKDIQMMTGHSVPVFIRVSWCIVTPTLMLVAFVAVLVTFDRPVYKGYIYPDYIGVVGILIGIVSIVPTPVLLLKNLLGQQGSLIQRLKCSILPSSDWGPNNGSLRQSYTIYKYNESSFWQMAKINILGSLQNKC